MILPEGSRLAGLALPAALALALGTGASAQVIDLAGETVTLVHNASPGGATGLGAQITADAWMQTMAGNPTIIVQSVEGGALRRGIDQVMNSRPDGLTLGWLAWQGSTRILDPEELQIDFSQFGLIGGVGGANFFLHLSTALGDGVAEGDLADVGTVTFGGFSAKSAASMQTAGALDLLGVDWTFASGFGGDGPLFAAMQRGEIDGYPATAVVYNQQLRDGPIADGESVGMFYYSAPTEDGAGMQPDPAFADAMPTFADYYTDRMGEAPSGPVWDMVQFHGRVSNPVNWIIVAPPGTPEEHLAMLRESFAAAVDTPEFRENAERVFGSYPNIVQSDEMISIAEEVQNTPEEIKDTMRDYIARMEGG